jgi:hypothetical protein
MYTRSAKVLLAALLCAGPAVTRADDLYFICNTRLPLTVADVRDMFLGEKQFAGPVKLVPVDNSTAQAAFLDQVLKMSAARYSTAWIKKSFRDGVNPPLLAGSDVEALAYVKRTLGACTYVTTPAAGDVAVIFKF